MTRHRTAHTALVMLLAAAAMLVPALALRGSPATEHPPQSAPAPGITPAATGSAVPENCREAWDEVRFLNYAGAARLFESLRRDAAAGSDLRREATMGLAVCRHYGQPDTEADKNEAAALYDELIADPSDHRYKPLALLLRARLADQIDFRGDKPDAETAVKLYIRLMQSHPGDFLAHEAAIYLAQLRIFSGDKATAANGIAELQAWAEAHRGNPCEGLQWMEVASAWCYPFDKPAKAVAALLEAEKAGLPAGVKRDGFLWQVACLARKAGDSATALRYFERIIREEPRSTFCYMSQRHIEELGGTPPPLQDPFEDWDSAAGRKADGP